jgi:hypothetical protein
MCAFLQLNKEFKGILGWRNWDVKMISSDNGKKSLPKIVLRFTRVVVFTNHTGYKKKECKSLFH